VSAFMSGAMRIGRLHGRCHAAPSAAGARDARDRTERAARTHLPAALQSAFGAWLDGSDDSVWIVRRLDLSILAAPDAPADALAAAMAAALARALSATLIGDGDGANAIRFDSRASYLARFVVDTAEGTAGRRWYYAPFGGLAALPAAAAIRT